MISPYDDEYFMKQAFMEAQKAYDAGEIPVGAKECDPERAR